MSELAKTIIDPTTTIAGNSCVNFDQVKTAEHGSQTSPTPFVADETVLASTFIPLPPIPGGSEIPKPMLVVAIGRRLAVVETTDDKWWVLDQIIFDQPITHLKIINTQRLIARKSRPSLHGLFWQECEVRCVRVETGKGRHLIYLGERRLFLAAEVEEIWQTKPEPPVFSFDQSELVVFLPSHPQTQLRTLASHLFLWNLRMKRETYLGPLRSADASVNVHAPESLIHPCSVYWEDWAVVLSRLSAKVLGRFRFPAKLSHFEALSFEAAAQGKHGALGVLVVALGKRLSLFNISESQPETSWVETVGDIRSVKSGRYILLNEGRSALVQRHFDLQVTGTDKALTFAVEETSAKRKLLPVALKTNRIPAFDLGRSMFETWVATDCAVEIRSQNGALFLYCRNNDFGIYLDKLLPAGKVNGRLLRCRSGKPWCISIFWGNRFLVLDITTLRIKPTVTVTASIEHLELIDCVECTQGRPWRNKIFAVLTSGNLLYVYDVSGSSPLLCSKYDFGEPITAVGVQRSDDFAENGESALVTLKTRADRLGVSLFLHNGSLQISPWGPRNINKIA